VILVDTSVWIDHLHARVPSLAALLEAGEVMTHPFVIGELACGMLKDRDHVLELLAVLPAMIVATDEEVLLFIERRKLMGRGIGYIDAHLLTSVRLTDDAEIWTRDKSLRETRGIFGSLLI
jgi:predicted nucleic acid-binding protein